MRILFATLISITLFCSYITKAEEQHALTATDVQVEEEPEIYMAPGIRPYTQLKEEEKEELSEDSKRTIQTIAATTNHYIPMEQTIDLVTFKLLRGVVNIATGWGEIPRQLYLSFMNDNFFLVLPLGLSRGIALTVTRTIVGVADVVLFFYSLDGTYGSFVNPSFVWQREDLNPHIQYPPVQ